MSSWRVVLPRLQLPSHRSVYLSCIGAVYMFAFSSYYLQFPGLYGWRGLLPIANRYNHNLSWQEALNRYFQSPCLALFGTLLTS